MSIIWIIVALAAIGLLLWAVNKYIPMPPLYKKAFTVVVVALVVYWLLRVFGLWAALMGARI